MNEQEHVNRYLASKFIHNVLKSKLVTGHADIETIIGETVSSIPALSENEKAAQDARQYLETLVNQVASIAN